MSSLLHTTHESDQSRPGFEMLYSESALKPEWEGLEGLLKTVSVKNRTILPNILQVPDAFSFNSFYDFIYSKYIIMYIVLYIICLKTNICCLFRVLALTAFILFGVSLFKKSIAQ